MQSGYHAVWWLVPDSEPTVVGSGPVDLLDGRRSIRPGETGRVAVHPMDPSAWRGVADGSVLHLRERPGQTLGVAVVRERVGVPDAAPLRLDAVPLRPGATPLVRQDGLFLRVPAAAPRRAGS